LSLQGQRLALGIEYDGSCYLGWQRQRQSPTVQEVLETAIAKVADAHCAVHAAGRTDTGVHARCQVAHFDSSADRSERQWLLGINSQLPDSVVVLWVKQVSTEFHARFSALARSYEYLICNRATRPALSRNRLAWVRQPLDIERMRTAAEYLLGEHDFSSFRAQGCQASSPCREIQQIAVKRHNELVSMHVRANGFLYHMVRNMAGTLIEIGANKHSLASMPALLAARDRTQAGMTAPPQGLYFLQAHYASEFSLPLAVT
jgi:tRNA pseudouridine38-40 synthase